MVKYSATYTKNNGQTRNRVSVYFTVTDNVSTFLLIN